MSHIVSVQFLKIKRFDLLKRAAERIGGKYLGRQRVRFYAGSAEGHAIQLPGWKYPIVVTEDGEIKYDNYGGVWGEQEKLDQFRQSYTREMVKDLAVQYGYQVHESVGQDGEIILELEQY